MEGMFYYVAQEEASIRNSPDNQTLSFYDKKNLF